jgi:hypothetical protein
MLLLAAVVAASLLCSCGDSEKSSAPRTFNLGDKVELGHISYQVFDTQWLTHLGEGADARIPQHRFFLVRLSAFNSLSTSIIVPNFSIEDDNGNTYAELSGGEGVNQYIGYLRNVKGTDSAQGNALFDAPPRHYKIKLGDETGEKFAYVDIPLTFTSENPDIPQAGGKEKK